MSADTPETPDLPDYPPAGFATMRFMDRVKYLIKTDEHMTAAECVGCLFLLAHELAACVFDDDEEP